MAFTTILGTGGAPDSIVGSAAVDVLFAQNLSNPTVITALGADDFINFSSFTNAVTNVTVSGGDGDDIIDGANDLFLTSSLVNGNAGNDDIDFETFNGSTIYGGAGDDEIESDLAINSLINGNLGDDEIEIISIESSSVFGGQGSDLITIGGGEINASFIRGNLGDDTITIVNGTTIVSTVINGNEGDDTIFFDGLSSSLIDSSVKGGKGSDTITFEGTSDGSLINGGDDADAISVTGELIDTVINGNAGNDNIFVDVLFTASEDSTVFGGAGDDTITFLGNGTTKDLIIQGNDGDDSITVFGDDLIIQGNDGDDSIIVDGVDNTITGGSGVDEIDILVDGDNTIIQTTGAAATAFAGLAITFGNGVDIITGADAETILAFAGALTDDTKFVINATSGRNFYRGTLTIVDDEEVFTVSNGGFDLLFGNGVAGNNAFVSFASNAVILEGSAATFDIDNYDNLLV